MHKLARQKHILNKLSENDRLSIGGLVEGLQAPVDITRQDLGELERQGVLQKSHDDVIAPNVPAMMHRGRNAPLPQTKQCLGQQVAARIPLGSTLFLGAGSAVLVVAAQPKRPMTVVTPSLDITQLSSDHADIQLILSDDRWDNEQWLLAGNATLSLVARYHTDIVILGIRALHAKLGLNASQEADTDVKRVTLATSAEH